MLDTRTYRIWAAAGRGGGPDQFFSTRMHSDAPTWRLDCCRVLPVRPVALHTCTGLDGAVGLDKHRCGVKQTQKNETMQVRGQSCHRAANKRQ